MLTLSRRVDESIYLYPREGLDPSMTVAELFADGPIQIMLTKIQTKGQVKIGICAHADLVIVREEIHRRESSLAAGYEFP